MDHVAELNHVIGWKDAKIKDREQNKYKRLIKESIWIRKNRGKVLNRDEGNYHLPPIYDQLILSTAPSTTKSGYKKPLSTMKKGH